MNRIIKFRAWDKQKKCMWDDINSSMAINFAGDLCSDFEDCLYDGNNDMRSEKDFFVMQYTGLKDKNGKEIYEEDIVQDKFIDVEGETLYIVEWYPPWACFIKKNIGNESFIDSAELRGDWLKLAKDRVDELNEKENRQTICYSTDSESLGQIYRESDTYYDMEVMGNIYANPELLKQVTN
jgi:uncharacterized phage protein (TIGR01671 family)